MYVDALVSTTEGTIIYEGVILDYELSKDGGLEYILLTKVERRYLKDDYREYGYYEIPGNILFIPVDEIINLNFTYWCLKLGGSGALESEMIS